MPSSQQIRRDFLDFFKERGHLIVPSAPIPVSGDGSTLFVVAGMAPFMDVFLGTEQPPAKRVADTQKVLRVSGKHNDLEEVGRDGTHHTFFEMLGNWSFGDYFKAEAIQFHWELVTKVWGIPPERLHATYFGGDAAHDLEPDHETARLWTELTDIDPAHVHSFAGVENDNFWAAGEVGACGICSEMHIDLTPDLSGAQFVNQDHPRVTELFNLVFIQFNRNVNGELQRLPQNHVDTGMGFERMTTVLQGVEYSYDTDLFVPLIEATHEITGARKYGRQWNDPIDDAYRIVADHIRALTFTIADGMVPSNESGGYVLRRILRRALRHGRQHLGAKGAWMYRLVPILIDIMGDAFPELRANPGDLADVIRDEEEGFARTLDRGIELFDVAAARSKGRISGEDAFKLYDTYGFPLDLTEVMASERGLEVDLEGYERLMDEQRLRARSAVRGADADASLVAIVQQEGPVDTQFLGYENTNAEVDTTLLVAMLDGALYRVRDDVPMDRRVAVVAGNTPFYGESGGQVGDTGIISGDGFRIRVDDTIRTGGVFWHLGTVEYGTLRAGAQRVRFEVDSDRRRRILANHTGTHMMNLGLRHVLGMHVDQKGSLVDDEKLRFDLSHPEPVQAEVIERIDTHVREDIARALTVYDKVVPQEQALGIRNVRAVFGEKYPPQVRIVSVGVPVDELLADPSSERWDEVSIELCGGTHLRTSSEAGAFVIVSEEAVAKGIRRLTAFTGERAADSIRRGEGLVQASSAPDADLTALNAAISDQTLPAVVRAQIRSRVQELQRERKESSKSSGAQRSAELVDDILALGDGPVLVGTVEAGSPQELRSAVEAARGRLQDQAVLVACVQDDAVTFVATVTKPLIERGLKAGDWVRETAEAAGGRAGGKPDFAQGGAKDPSKLGAALETARVFAEKALG